MNYSLFTITLQNKGHVSSYTELPIVVPKAQKAQVFLASEKMYRLFLFICGIQFNLDGHFASSLQQLNLKIMVVITELSLRFRL